ncbi:MAG: hypothetical protein ACI89L_001328 [Phycisphaerales bacterium]|jgi:hypothetical protein
MRSETMISRLCSGRGVCLVAIAVLIWPAQGRTELAGPVELVEIVDWVTVTGISRDLESRYEVVRSATLPYVGSVYKEYFPTVQTPAGWINPYFNVSRAPGTFVFEEIWFGEVSSASGDGSTDGPFSEFAMLIRTTVPVAYANEAGAYIGTGAGDPSNVPWARLSIREGFCFLPGAVPAVGQPICQTNPSGDLVSVRRADSSGYEAALDGCCPVGADRGGAFGVLDPGEYTIYLRTGADMNLLFSFGSYADVSGTNVLDLYWDEPCAADLNGDGIADQGDIQSFIALFLAGDLAVDFNGDGIVDLGDIQEFIAAFLAGC